MEHILSRDNIIVSENVHKRWKQELNQYGILYIYAMSGYGKTVQAVEFAKREYKEWVYMAASEHLCADMETYFKKKKSGKMKSLIIIDDLQWIQNQVERDLFHEALLSILRNHKQTHCLLLSRARLPKYLNALKLTKQLVLEDLTSLRLSEDIAMEFIKSSGLIEKRPELFPESNIVQNYIVQASIKNCGGYAIALNALIERLKEPGVDYQTAYSQGLQDVYDYFDLHIYQNWDQLHKEAMLRLAICDSFHLDLAMILLGDKAQFLLTEMNEIGSFMNHNADDVYQIHPIFLGFLRDKLKQIPQKEKNNLYDRAGQYYENKRDMIQALQMFQKGEDFEHIINIICYLSENADGCAFAKTCYRYIEELPEEYEDRYPQLLGAKAMIYSYHMELEKSDYYLEKLKQKTEEEKQSKVGNQALIHYVRTLIALPHGSAEKTMENLKVFPEFIKANGIHINNVMPTGNMPSMINGGLDLLPWAKNYKVIYPVMKYGSEAILGKEAVGIADVSVGEHLYEMNQPAKALAYLTKGLSEANLNGSIRVQYAATGVMARVFQADQQWETAKEILKNVMEQAKKLSFMELVPNIRATIEEVDLLQGNRHEHELWLQTNPVDEHEMFFITERYRLIVKAKVYLALGRNMEALYILELLYKYTERFSRTYFQMQVKILRAIAYERTGADWMEELLEAVKTAEHYKYIRILADQGNALYPLWKELMEREEYKTQIDEKYAASVTKELKRMAALYPHFLEIQRKPGSMTKKEIEVLKCMSEGMNNQQIAEQLSLSLATVKFHISNILKKLQVENRTGAVYIAKQEGLV